MSQSSKPTPIALPNELNEELDLMAVTFKMTKQDLMRLAMRIGLVDLRAAKDIAQVMQETASDKGASFLAFARQRLFQLEGSGEGPIPPRQEIAGYAPKKKSAKHPPIAGGGGSALHGRMVAEEHEK